MWIDERNSKIEELSICGVSPKDLMMESYFSEGFWKDQKQLQRATDTDNTNERTVLMIISRYVTK